MDSGSRSFNVNAPAFSPPELTGSSGQGQIQKSPQHSTADESTENHNVSEITNKNETIESTQTSPSDNNGGQNEHSLTKKKSRNRGKGKNSNQAQNQNQSQSQKQHSQPNQRSNHLSSTSPNSSQGTARNHGKGAKTSPKNQEINIDGESNLENQNTTTPTTNTNKSKRGQVSISHLLNFGLPSRPQSGGTPSRKSSRRASTNHRKQIDQINGHYHTTPLSLPPPDSLTYIQTTCRFVLDPDYQEQYRGLLEDPDYLVPIEHVLRVLSRTITCPICLDDAKAPRMLLCGHVMCYPCFLRFMGMGVKDKNDINGIDGGDFEYKHTKAKECPLCFQPIEASLIRPVTFLEYDGKFEAPKRDSKAVMKLMFRPRLDMSNTGESTFMNAVPISSDEISSSLFNCIPIISPTCLTYTRLMLPTREFLLDKCEKEISELKMFRDEEELLYCDDSTTKYYNKAIRKITSEIEKIKSSTKYDENVIKTGQLMQRVTADNLAITMNNNNNNNSENVTGYPYSETERYLAKFDDSSAYYFYLSAFQSEVKYVLSSLDVKILHHEFQSYKNLPSSIIIKIGNLSPTNYVSPELRKRFKYLNHLPDYTEVVFIECDWLSQSNTKNHGKKEKGKNKSADHDLLNTNSHDNKEEEEENNNNRNTIHSSSSNDSNDSNKSDNGNNSGSSGSSNGKSQEIENGTGSPPTGKVLKLSTETLKHFQKELNRRREEHNKRLRREQHEARVLQKIEEMRVQDILRVGGGFNSTQTLESYQKALQSDASFPSLNYSSNNSGNDTDTDTRKKRQINTRDNNNNVNGNGNQLDDNYDDDGYDYSEDLGLESGSINNSSRNSSRSGGGVNNSRGSNNINNNNNSNVKKTVWGTNAITFSKGSEDEKLTSREHNNDNNLFSESGWRLDISSLSLSSNNNNSGNGNGDDNNNSSLKSNKKKGKKLVLMSTTRPRS